MMRAVLIVLCLAALLACDETQTGPTVALNQEFELAAGGSAAIEDASLTVRFNNVPSDSRCPGDALCIQQGDAVVRVSVISGGNTQDIELHTAANGQPVRVNDVNIALVQLQPYPFSSRPPITQEEYRATLKVTR